MRIDMEQFLAMTVALGTVGALGAAVYTTRPDLRVAVDRIRGVETVEPEATVAEPDEVPKPGEPAVTTLVPIPVPVPVLSEPTEEPAVESDADAIPGPDIETANW